MLENLLRKSSLSFKARSPARDNEVILTLVGQVSNALDHAAREIEAQRDGLRRRLDAVITRAAVIGGNDIEASSTRDEADAAALAASDIEIARAEARLKILEEQLSHFIFLEDALHSRFPILNRRPSVSARTNL
jgi:hypothetical protein